MDRGSTMWGENEGRLGLALDLLVGKQWLAVTIAGATGYALRLCACPLVYSLVLSRCIWEGLAYPPLMIAQCPSTGRGWSVSTDAHGRKAK